MNKILKIILVILIIAGLVAVRIKCAGLSFLQVAPTHIADVNTSDTITTKNTTVTYTPNATKTDQHPKSITVYKPLESSVKVKNGVITIDHIGFCFEPFIGDSFTLQDQFRPYLSCRLIYWNQMGLQLGVNDRRAFIGADYRLPILNLLSISCGETLGFNTSFAPYIGLSTQISI